MYKYYVESKINIRNLKEFTKNTMFKTPINKRKKDVGKITYKGWSKELYSLGNKIVAAANLYFVVEGKRYFDKKKKVFRRPKYIQILQIPYKKSYHKQFKAIYDDTPVKIYSSDPSFKYYLAYALNTINAVVRNKETEKELGIALTKRPNIRNPKLHKEFNKHFYRLVEFIASKRISKYLDDRYYLGINKMPQINERKR
jgi:hypothetical protein